MCDPKSILGLDPLTGLAVQGKPTNPVDLVTPKPPPLPSPPTLSNSVIDAETSAARARQRALAANRKGRKSTILTGGTGVTGDAPLSQPQALGA